MTADHHNSNCFLNESPNFISHWFGGKEKSCFWDLNQSLKGKIQPEYNSHVLPRSNGVSRDKAWKQSSAHIYPTQSNCNLHFCQHSTHYVKKRERLIFTICHFFSFLNFPLRLTNTLLSYVNCLKRIFPLSDSNSADSRFTAAGTQVTDYCNKKWSPTLISWNYSPASKHLLWQRAVSFNTILKFSKMCKSWPCCWWVATVRS